MAYISLRVEVQEYSHRFQELKYLIVSNTLSDRLLKSILASTRILNF